MRRNLLTSVLRNPLLIPAAIIVAAGVGFGACRAMKYATYGSELRAAAVITMIASGLGILPSWFLRKSEPGTLANASLGGTLLHTLVTLTLGALWWMNQPPIARTPFLTWLTVLYWVSLAALATVTISMVKAMTPQPTRSMPSVPRPAPAPQAPRQATTPPPARTTPPRPGSSTRPTPPPPRRGN